MSNDRADLRCARGIRHARCSARRGASRSGSRLSAYGCVHAHFLSKDLAEELGFHHTRLPLIVLIGGILAASADTSAVLRVCNRLSVEHRRQALEQLAVVYSGHIRDDDSGGRAHRRAWHACAERSADAVPSAVQSTRVSHWRREIVFFSASRRPTAISIAKQPSAFYPACTRPT